MSQAPLIRRVACLLVHEILFELNYPYSMSSFHTFRDRFRTTVNVLGDCFGVGIVQHYSRKQLGTPSPPVVSAQEGTSFPLSPREERAGASSPLYGSSNGGDYVAPTDSLMHVGPSVLRESEGTTTDSKDIVNNNIHTLGGGSDSAPSTDKDETNL